MADGNVKIGIDLDTAKARTEAEILANEVTRLNEVLTRTKQIQQDYEKQLTQVAEGSKAYIDLQKQKSAAIKESDKIAKDLANTELNLAKIESQRNLREQISQEKASSEQKKILAKESENAAKAERDLAKAESERNLKEQITQEKAASEQKKILARETELAAKAVQDAAEKEAAAVQKAAQTQAEALNKSFIGINAQLDIAQKVVQVAKLAFEGLREVFSSSVGAAVVFEAQLAKIQTVLPPGASAAGIFTQSLKDLQTQFGLTAEQAGEGIYQALQSGIVSASDATEFLTTASKLAVGGLTDLSGATNILTSYMAA
jgi:hypothetical protein